MASIESTCRGDEFFSSANPSVLGLPHLISALDAEFLGKVAHLTKSRLGLWHVPAPFDEQDHFDNMRETAPLSAWALPLNQAEILAFTPLIEETVFGTKLMILDAQVDEAILARLAVPAGYRLPSGAWFTPGYQDLPDMGQLIAQCGWSLIPIGPERSLGLFVTHAGKADVIANLTEWCQREGRNSGQFRSDQGQVTLVQQTAPDAQRNKAIAHEIDSFLSRFEIYFGDPDGSIAETVAERLQERRRLRQEIVRTRKSSAPE